jgi:hypothetical protein
LLPFFRENSNLIANIAASAPLAAGNAGDYFNI